MTKEELATQRVLAEINVRQQGYSEEQATRMARRWYPRPQDAALVAARAAKAARRAASQMTGAGSSTEVTVIESSGAGRMSQPATHPKARRSSSASSAANKVRWARVRELGLHNLKELSMYDQAQREGVA